jgi:hypothetical protein
MPQGHKNKDPQVRLALTDFFWVEPVPTRRENVSRKFRIKIEAARELYLQA